MKKDTKVSKFITEYIRTNHIMEVETLSDKIDKIEIVIPDKKNKPYDFIIGNKTNNIKFERGQSTMTVSENDTVVYGASDNEKVLNILNNSLLKLEASTKDLDSLSIYDLAVSGDDFYIAEITFNNRILYCMGTKHNLDANLKTMQNVAQLQNYTLCGIANAYIVTRLLKTLSSRKDFTMFADTEEKRTSFTVSEKSYNFILGGQQYYEVIALALSKNILIRPFHKGGKTIE